MFRLALMLYTIISATLAGMAIVAVIVTGYSTLVPILVAAAAGFTVAVPVSIVMAKSLYTG